MATKTPVSALQEYAVKNFLPFPSYQYSDETNQEPSHKFICHCICGSVTAEASASSKKLAKHNVADIVLKKLGVSKGDNIQIIPNPTVVQSVSFLTQYNPIGKLNEYCSQYRYSYPDYNEMGAKDGQFIIRCTHQSLVAEGYASTKKAAKQEAAYKMLERLGKVTPGKTRQSTSRETSPAPSTNTLENSTSKINLPRPSTVDTHKLKIDQFTDEEIIERYNQISIRHQMESKIKSEPTYNIVDPFMPDVVSKAPPLEITKVSNEDVVELEKKLKNMDIAYNIEKVSEQPCILTLHSKGHTYMEMGDNYVETKAKLLTNTLNFLLSQ